MNVGYERSRSAGDGETTGPMTSAKSLHLRVTWNLVYGSDSYLGMDFWTSQPSYCGAAMAAVTGVTLLCNSRRTFKMELYLHLQGCGWIALASPKFRAGFTHPAYEIS